MSQRFSVWHGTYTKYVFITHVEVSLPPNFCRLCKIPKLIFFESPLSLIISYQPLLLIAVFVHRFGARSRK
jgi:hypothetical protein